MGGGNGRLATYHVRQQEAFDERARRTEEGADGAVHVWAQEYNKDGHRKYLCGTLAELWRSMHVLDACHRHFYELIYGDAWARLYMDVEVYRSGKHAPTWRRARWLDERYCNARMDDLFAHIRSLLSELYGDEVAQCVRFVQTDSSNERKFSRHVVAHMQCGDVEYAFESTVHAGRFVDLLVERNAGTYVAQMVDRAVYTRNRCFRLPGSCKYGSDRYLHPYDTKTQRATRDPRNVDELARYLVTQSLPESGVRTLRVEDEQTAELSRRLPARLVAPQHHRSGGSDSNVGLLLLSSSSSSFDHVALALDKREAVSALDSAAVGVVQPRLDELAQRVAQELNLCAHIRYHPSTHTLVCSDGHDRYCRIQGREHRSNHVYWTIVLFSDIADRTGRMRAKCLDPDCQAQQQPQQRQRAPEMRVTDRSRAIQPLLDEYARIVRANGACVDVDELTWLVSVG